MTDRSFFETCLHSYNATWGRTPCSPERKRFIDNYACTLSIINHYNVRGVLQGDSTSLLESYSPALDQFKPTGDIGRELTSTEGPSLLQNFLESNVEQSVKLIRNIVEADVAIGAV